MNKSHNT